MDKAIWILLLFMVLFSCNEPLREGVHANIQLIPEPQEITALNRIF